MSIHVVIMWVSTCFPDYYNDTYKRIYVCVFSSTSIYINIIIGTQLYNYNIYIFVYINKYV
jgi:hypothetical protein